MEIAPAPLGIVVSSRTHATLDLTRVRSDSTILSGALVCLQLYDLRGLLVSLVKLSAAFWWYMAG